MRSALWSALLCGVTAELAAAQGVPVTFEEPQPVGVTGFAVGTADYDRLAHTNTLAAGKMALSLFKPAGDFYFFGQLTTALEGGEAATEIDNLIVSWTPSGANQWSLAFGRFDAPIGFERDDEPLNLVPTNSFNFQLARPGKLTGAILRYTASPHFDFAAALANGWEVVQDNNRGKTGLVRAEWIASEGFTAGITGVYGPERDATDALQRSLVSADVTFQRGPLIVGTELNVGGERDGMGGSNSWAGGAVTGFVRLGRSLGLSARYDHLDDTKAVLTGVPQVLRSFTVGPMWFYSSAQEGIFSNIEHTTFHLPRIAVRTALRVDYSTQPFFESGQSGRNTTAVIELVYLF